jgi:hypothetical protein
MPAHGTFYGYEQKFGVSRLYKIYITEGALCGAKVADNDYEASKAFSDKMPKLLFGGLNKSLVNEEYLATKHKALQRENLLDTMDPGGPSFLGDDKSNFSLGPAQVSSATVNLTLGMMQKGSTRCGSLELVLTDGSRRRFFLIGTHDPQEVIGNLKRLLPNLQVNN